MAITAYYPSILDTHNMLDPMQTDEAIRRAYDLIYRILPPSGSNVPSAITLLTDVNIASLSISNLTTGTLQPAVTMTLAAQTIATPLPAKIIWESSAETFVDATVTNVYWRPLVDDTKFLKIGFTNRRWASIGLFGILTSITCGDNTATYTSSNFTDTGVSFGYGTGGTITNTLEATSAALYPFTNNTTDLGTSAATFKNFFLAGKLKRYNNAAPTDGQLLIGNTAGVRFDAATLTGTAGQLTITNGAGTITISMPNPVLFDKIEVATSIKANTIFNTSGNLVLSTVTSGDIQLTSAAAITITPTSTCSVVGAFAQSSGNFTSNGSIGFFGVAAAARQTSGADLTNNVTSGGSSDVIANFTDLTTYSNDAATIRNDIYQLARKVKQVNDALRLYGLLT